MVITTEASTLDQAKQFPLDTLREDILVLFDNQIVEKDATVSDTNYDSPGADVDIYIFDN